MTTDLEFPPGFLWGTASSAFQVEGGNANNQWSRYELVPGAVAEGQRSGQACNWWQAAEADFDRMQALGLNAHRMSVEWSRVEPAPGKFDTAALARYREMVAGLRARGITPWVALHHFTNPLWLEEMGGWENPAVVGRFARYAAVVVDALGDVCDTWLTFNEPLVYLGQGWLRGVWPPHHPNLLTALRVFRHLLEAHAAAYHAIKARRPQTQVSIAKAMRHFDPARPAHPGDRLAARFRRYLFEDLWFAATLDGRLLPPLGRGQTVAHLANTLDFLGLNYYARYQVTFTPDPRKLFGVDGYTLGRELSDPTAGRGPYSQFDPEGLGVILRRFAGRGKPLYVTEHGLPDDDDDQRPRWIVAQLAVIQAAICAGADVRGYFHWAFTDNFEWSDGWTMHFGLVGMDTHTQVRTVRPSAQLYGAIARANGITRAQLATYAPAYSPGSTGE